MGLDQYIYRMKKATKKDIAAYTGKKEMEIPWQKYFLLEKEDVDRCPEMYGDLMDILQPIKVINSYINFELIRKDYAIPDDWRCACSVIDNGTHTYTFRKDEKTSKLVQIPDDVFEEKYIYNQEVTSYICQRQEIHYMRKEYNIQESMYDLYHGTIDNCGYYHMSEYMIDTLNHYSRKRVLDPRAKNLYYHEWY